MQPQATLCVLRCDQLGWCARNLRCTLPPGHQPPVARSQAAARARPACSGCTLGCMCSCCRWRACLVAAASRRDHTALEHILGKLANHLPHRPCTACGQYNVRFPARTCCQRRAVSCEQGAGAAGPKWAHVAHVSVARTAPCCKAACPPPPPPPHTPAAADTYTVSPSLGCPILMRLL